MPTTNDNTTVDERDTAHTPGPWAVEDVRVFAPAFDEKVTLTREDGSTVEHGTGLIALVYSCGPWDAKFGGSEANRRLIAAAPELLDALRAFCGDHEATGFECAGLTAAYLHAKRVIAKAEGR